MSKNPDKTVDKKQTANNNSSNVETIILKNGTIINGKFYKKGSVIKATEEVKETLKKFGYFKSIKQ